MTENEKVEVIDRSTEGSSVGPNLGPKVVDIHVKFLLYRARSLDLAEGAAKEESVRLIAPFGLTEAPGPI